jgi:UDP-2-acetamido-3-amino-2,3-dideoxy-glucuronate N-acetyltransferase
MSQNIYQTSLVSNVDFGTNVKIGPWCNIYGCKIGDETKVGPYVEIQKEAHIGKRVIISSHSFICSFVTIEDDVFIGHGVMTVNDLHPPSLRRSGTTDGWKGTIIKKGAVIGSNVTLLPVTIGSYAEVGAGAVVTKDVPDYCVVVGNPAQAIRTKKA